MEDVKNYQYGQREYRHMAYGIAIIVTAGLLAKGCQEYEVKKGLAGGHARQGGLEQKVK